MLFLMGLSSSRPKPQRRRLVGASPLAAVNVSILTVFIRSVFRSEFQLVTALTFDARAIGFFGQFRNHAYWLKESRRDGWWRVILSSSVEPQQQAGIGVGIDLGTTRSAIAFLQKDGVPSIVPIPGNGRTLASVVNFIPTLNDDDGGQPRQLSFHGTDVLVGEEASERAAELYAYRNVKRVIGTGGKVPTDIQKVVPYLVLNPDGKTYKKDNLQNQLYDAQHFPTMLHRQQNLSSTSVKELIFPEEISSIILKALKTAAESHTSQIVTRAVIGVPAYFNDAQREATKRAAEMAGIRKVKLLPEPEAAALAYGVGRRQLMDGFEENQSEELVLVFDLGGGTYDVSMLLVGGGVTEVLCTSGNVRLGGCDWDARVAQHLLSVIRQHGGSTNSWSKSTNHAVLRSAEAIRISLTNNRVARCVLPLSEDEWRKMTTPTHVILPVDKHGSLLTPEGTANSTHVICYLSRRTMERLCKSEFQALLKPLREVAIMSGAFLPGDSSPSIVDAILGPEEVMEGSSQAQRRAIDPLFGEFYGEASEVLPKEDALLLNQMDVKQAKKAQQQGRKRARHVAKEERQYRQEKRKIEDTRVRGSHGLSTTEDDRIKVRDGITGRPIARVVLVGGATRMPAIGRLLTAVVGVVPQRTVNPDEAVALGCAVQVGVLDGQDGVGTVLNPMQAAILRAVAEKQASLLLGDNENSVDGPETMYPFGNDNE